MGPSGALGREPGEAPAAAACSRRGLARPCARGRDDPAHGGARPAAPRISVPPRRRAHRRRRFLPRSRAETMSTETASGPTEDQVEILEYNFNKVNKHPDPTTLCLIAAEAGLSEEETQVSPAYARPPHPCPPGPSRARGVPLALPLSSVASARTPGALTPPHPSVRAPRAPSARPAPARGGSPGTFRTLPITLPSPYFGALPVGREKRAILLLGWELRPWCSLASLPPPPSSISPLGCERNFCKGTLCAL